jgi:hypothetical protein
MAEVDRARDRRLVRLRLEHTHAEVQLVCDADLLVTRDWRRHQHHSAREFGGSYARASGSDEYVNESCAPK